MGCTSLLFVAFLLLFICWPGKNWLFIWRVNGWRGVLQQPLLWFLLLFITKPENILAAATKLRRYFKRPLAFLFGPLLFLYVDDPATMEQILNAPECLDKTFYQNGFFAAKGIFHAKGPQWRTRRRQLNPSFSISVLLSFFPTFNAVGGRLRRKLSDFTGDAVQLAAVEDLVSKAVMEMAFRTIMGSDMDLIDDDSEDQTRIYKILVKVSALRTVRPWMQIERVFWMLDRELYDLEKECNREAAEFVDKIVVSKYREWQMRRAEEAAMRRKDPRRSEGRDELESDSGTEYEDFTAAPDAKDQPARKRIFIEQLFHLAERGEMTLQEIMDESHSMMLAATESVSNSLVIALLLLAMHPECQRRLRREISRVLPTSAQPDAPCISSEDLRQMPYLDMFHEALRLLTTIPGNMRCVGPGFRLKLPADDAAKEAAAVSVPAGTSVMLDVFNMQRDPQNWGIRAQQFQPEHFAASPADGEKSPQRRLPYAFLPFSKGPRMCIGHRYSTWLSKILLINLVCDYEFGTTTKLHELQFMGGNS